ncbi:MAG: sterol desaturase family protein [Proteobacteria bacterium]|nr:sterol desaturase family protein [Pseudomonadota bacterium]
MDTLSLWFGQMHTALFEGVVQPLLFALGGAAYLEDAYLGTAWLMLGLVQIAILALVLAPLQAFWPDEPVQPSAQRRRAVAVDVLYTLIHRLGLFRVALFFTLEPLWNALFGWSAVAGLDGWQLDQWLAPLWPGVTDTALFGFVLYLVVLDFVDYWFHRGQHRLRWWWALHAVHHSQQHLTVWSDNRNHLLDDVLRDVVLVLVARAIGVAPAQFMLLVVLGQMIESLSHANLRWHWGPWLRYLLVSPRYHRQHHIMAVEPGTWGHNYAVLLPIWDVLLGTARFAAPTAPSGIADQQQGRDNYGQGFWAQQWLGLKRLAARE